MSTTQKFFEMGTSKAPSKIITKYITDMYSDPLASAVRETVSNALDACLGQPDREVRVWIDNPVFETDDGILHVLDNGKGMSEDDLSTVFSQYGVSNKSKDNNTIGAFGLGAKSPLAYTNIMRVITKQDKSDCLVMDAYRTVDDAFMADIPSIIPNKGMTISHDLDVKSGRVCLDDSGIDGSSCREESFIVNDVISERGYDHGTMVSFPVHYEDLLKAHVIVYTINDILSGTRGFSILDESMRAAYDEYLLNAGHPNEGFYRIKNYDDHDMMNITSYLFCPSNNYCLNSHPLFAIYQSLNDMDAGNPTDSIRNEKIALLVGDYLYYSDGSKMKYPTSLENKPFIASGYRNQSSISLVIEVPSDRLDFLPSRDAIVLNQKLDEIIKKALANLKSAFHDSSFVTDYALFIMRRYHMNFTRTIKMLYSTNVVNFDQDDDILSLEISDTNDMIANLSLNDIRDVTTGGYSIAELMDTPVVGVGIWVRGKAQGMYLSPTDALGQLLVDSYNMGRFHYNDSVTNKYGTSRHKTVSDKIINGCDRPLYHDDEFDEDCDHHDDNFIVTSAIPSGIGVYNITSYILAASTRNIINLMIVDASRVGIKSARMACSNLIEEMYPDQFNDYGTTFEVVFIPPCQEGTPEKIIEIVKNTCDGWGTDRNQYFTSVLKTHKVFEMSVVSADELDSFIAKQKATKKNHNKIDDDIIASEIRKMISNSQCKYYTIDDGIKVQHLRFHQEKEIQNDLSKTAVIIVNQLACFSSHKSQLMLNLMGYQHEIPDYITNVLIVPKRNCNVERADMLCKKGMSVLWVDDDKNMQYPQALIPSDRYVVMNSSRLMYSGDVTSIRDSENLKSAYDQMLSMYNSALTSFSGNYRSYKCHMTMSMMLSFIRTITFGNENCVKSFGDEITNRISNDGMRLSNIGTHHDYNKIKKNDYVINLQDYSFTQLDDDTREYQKEMNDMKSRFCDVLLIWNSYLKQYSVSIDFAEYKSASCFEALSLLGEAWGIKSDIDAYYHGVPIESLMIGR